MLAPNTLESKVYDTLGRKYNYPHMVCDVYQTFKECHNLHKVYRAYLHRKHLKLSSTTVPIGFIAIDIAGAFLKSAKKILP